MSHLISEVRPFLVFALWSLFCAQFILFLLFRFNEKTCPNTTSSNCIFLVKKTPLPLFDLFYNYCVSSLTKHVPLSQFDLLFVTSSNFDFSRNRKAPLSLFDLLFILDISCDLRNYKLPLLQFDPLFNPLLFYQLCSLFYIPFAYSLFSS